MTWRWTWWLCLALVGALVPARDSGGAGADLRLQLSSFTTRGDKDDGRLHWEMKGARAIVRGPYAELEALELFFHFKDRETVKVTSPKCRFNQTTAVVESEASIEVASPTIRLVGTGYDIITDKQQLHIHRDVNMILRKTGTVAKGLPDLGGGAAATPGEGHDSAKKAGR